MELERERWDRRYAEGAHETRPPAWVDPLDDALPRSGAALDIAAGTGALALYFARRGMRALAVDISPVALARCREAALAEGVPVDTLVADLTHDPLPPGPFDVITCRDYLQRDLMPRLANVLSPGGVLVAEIATRRNLARHAHPSARYLLEPNELLRLVRPLEIVYYREGVVQDRCVACVLARRPRHDGE